MKKAALHNLGCKVNSYETEAMKQQLEDDGYEIVSFNQVADVYIINTCTVTNIADRKSRQMLHKAKKINPDATVVAVGCYVQASKGQLEKDNAVDILIGNNRKKDLIKILHEHNLSGHPQDAFIDIGDTKEYEELKLLNLAERTRVNIKVQDGCNQFCSYCIIPYTRGRVRSRAINDIIEEVKILTSKGIKEIVLTGIHLSSYGIDFEDGTDLLGLIEEINKIDGIERIRLGSLEPRIITEKFVKVLSKTEKFCPHFHLSLQSGSDSILKRMNRKYTTDQYYEKCKLIREYINNPAITTDIIVGFPGESDKDFKETFLFLKKIKFASIHVFKYSMRQGTIAADFPDQINNLLKASRSDALIELAKEMTISYNKSYINQNVHILMEDEMVLENKKYIIGHTKEYVKIALPFREGLRNEIINVRPVAFLSEEILLAQSINMV